MPSEARKTVLVWGSNVADDRMMAGTAGAGRGPPAGRFRLAVRAALRRAMPDCRVDFSETAARFRHRHQNAGFYEPRQLQSAAAVVMLMPGDRAMAVNTWEVALAFESWGSLPADERHQSARRIVLVVPKTVRVFLGRCFEAGIRDPAHDGPFGRGQPVLGPQCSFAARWVFLALEPLLRRRSTGFSPAEWGLVSYADDTAYDVDADACRESIHAITRRVQAALQPL